MTSSLENGESQETHRLRLHQPLRIPRKEVSDYKSREEVGLEEITKEQSEKVKSHSVEEEKKTVTDEDDANIHIQKKSRRMDLGEVISIREVDRSVAQLMFSGYTLNSYGLRRGRTQSHNVRLRIDMTDVYGNETITVWMFYNIAEKGNKNSAKTNGLRYMKNFSIQHQDYVCWFTLYQLANILTFTKIKFFGKSMPYFEILMQEFYSGNAPTRCFINIQGDGIFKHANATDITIITDVIICDKKKSLEYLFRTIAENFDGVKGWFEIDNLYPVSLQTTCSSCKTLVMKRISRFEADCESCTYKGLVRQQISLKGKLHSSESVQDLIIRSYLIDQLYPQVSSLQELWREDSTKAKIHMAGNPPHGRFAVGIGNGIMGFAPNK
ncbi:hypothetical protein SELMODRAFT_430653 [Selaginella moellendorffii]|uniref:Uncharacterized protein n=1 Tax=Selaginella moellendorffii TaxID=88036 RepID=D8TA28_SELML|nr:hypothetical protein SELMODRAFT_430653 [Selaginella moellendorffii]